MNKSSRVFQDNQNLNDMYKDKAQNIDNRRNLSTEDKIDHLLELNADQYCNLGTESTKTEWTTAELTSRFIFRLIKKYDQRLGKMLLRDSLQG